jgi:hypothetical protein
MKVLSCKITHSFTVLLGEVAERPNAAVSKTVILVRGSGVQIPPSPNFLNSAAHLQTSRYKPGFSRHVLPGKALHRRV